VASDDGEGGRLPRSCPRKTTGKGGREEWKKKGVHLKKSRRGKKGRNPRGFGVKGRVARDLVDLLLRRPCEKAQIWRVHPHEQGTREVAYDRFCIARELTQFIQGTSAGKDDGIGVRRGRGDIFWRRRNGPH